MVFEKFGLLELYEIIIFKIYNIKENSASTLLQAKFS